MFRGEFVTILKHMRVTTLNRSTHHHQHLFFLIRLRVLLRSIRRFEFIPTIRQRMFVHMRREGRELLQRLIRSLLCCFHWRRPRQFHHLLCNNHIDSRQFSNC